MGSCCSQRKEIGNEESKCLKNDHRELYKKTKFYNLLEEYKINDKNQDFLHELYSYAKTKEDINILTELLNNNTLVTPKTNIDYRLNWISQPKTIGDNVILIMLGIIERNLCLCDVESHLLYSINTESTSYSPDSNYSQLEIYAYTNPQNKLERIVIDIEKNELINKLFWLLLNGSDTKKDCSILILLKLSYNKNLLKYMSTRSSIKVLMNHINNFKVLKYKYFKEHVITTLQLISNIYICDIELKKFFIEAKGIDILYDLISTWDLDILISVMQNFEDLIFHENEKYSSVPKLVINEIVDMLYNINFQDKLMKINNETIKEPGKYDSITESLNRLISIFYQTQILNTSSNILNSFENN